MRANGALNEGRRRLLQSAGAAVAGAALGTIPLAAKDLRRGLGLGS
ncbi:MAG: hypothetical protein Q7W02_18615 [Candidatus Rokubacteria bacterium]|nr:hypothetical protein [Candidatus Rokubacteria bacterium]